MNILIVEDEQLAVDKLLAALSIVAPDARVEAILGSIGKTLLWLKGHTSPDLILMDIELADGQCFEIFKQHQVNCPVIFTTSYDEYAIRAFKMNGIDYLLKPIEPEDLQLAMDKYHRLRQVFHSSTPSFDIRQLVDQLKEQIVNTAHRSRFLVKYGQQLVSIETLDIAYFFAEARVSFFITWDKRKYIVDYTLEELEQMLDPVHFFRANRSVIVHIRSVKQIHNYFNGKLKIQLEPIMENLECVVSKERAASFKSWLGR